MKTLYIYGMRLRGFSIGAQPEEGWVDTEEDPLGDYWNILVYSRRLRREECEHYDLDFLGKREAAQ